jgi:hypothetical protein
MDFLELLSQKGLIKKDDISSILSESEKSGVPVEQVLIKMGISPEEILRAKGDYLDIPTKVIDKSDVSFKLLELVPEESALHYKFVPLSITDGVLNVGIVYSSDNGFG